MRVLTLFLLIGICFPAYSQSLLYEAFEVDSAAQPKGGMGTLALFVQTNLRPPVAAIAAGLGGKVYVQGVVNPDGRMSDLVVVRGLRSDCDREALRVVSLFGAWQPALKNRQAVRQKVSVPVDFRLQPVLWTYKNGQKIEFVGENDQLVPDEKSAIYKVITPVDSAGNLTGDVTIYKLSGPRKPVATNSLTRTFVNDPNGQAVPKDSARFLRVALVAQNGSLIGEVRHFYKTGELYSVAIYAGGRRVGETKQYYKNGVVSDLLTYSTKNSNEHDLLRWYPNGQIRQGSSVGKLTSFWLPDGTLVVSQGTGLFKDSTEYNSERILEEGRYVNGFKDGRWQANRANGQVVYEEEFSAGKVLRGKTYDSSGKAMAYDVEQPAEFIGGIKALMQFLSTNINYPISAQKAKASGQVMVSFVVNPDGTLTDINVVNGVGFGLDEEAVRVVKRMKGRWKPGTQRGRAVKSRFNLPITFSMQ